MDVGDLTLGLDITIEHVNREFRARVERLNSSQVEYICNHLIDFLDDQIGGCVRGRIAELEQSERTMRAEIVDYEQTDLVPRSRYKALQRDWPEAREQVKRVADKAAAEIGRLEKENATLRGGNDDEMQ